MARFSRQAVLEWTGDLPKGAGTVSAASGAFRSAASFPRTVGEPANTTTPEELLAAAHAVCFGIGLRSVIGQRGGRARRVTVTATITAEKSGGGILVESSHLSSIVEGLEGIDSFLLPEIAAATERGCTISNAIRGTVSITHDVRAAD